MTLVHTVRPKLRPFLYSLLILLTLFYFLSLCLGSVEFFHALLSKAGVSSPILFLAENWMLQLDCIFYLFFCARGNPRFCSFYVACQPSAGRRGGSQSPHRGHGAPNLPMGVMGPAEAPAPMWLKNYIEQVFFQIRGRKSGENVLQKLFDDLRLETASPQKRRQIVQILGHLLKDETLRFGNRDKKFNLNTELLVRISDWERDQ